MTREEFRGYAKEFPILGGLIVCDGRDHWNALGQMTVLFVLSTMPIWLGTLIVYATGVFTGYLGAGLAVHSTIARGELFMYATAFLAPVFWIALTDRPGQDRFPSKLSHIVVMVVILVIAAVFFGLETAGNKLNQKFTLGLANITFVASSALLYLGILYHEHRDRRDAANKMKQDEQDFTAKFREHKHES